MTSITGWPKMFFIRNFRDQSHFTLNVINFSCRDKNNTKSRLLIKGIYHLQEEVIKISLKLFITIKDAYTSIEKTYVHN